MPTHSPAPALMLWPGKALGGGVSSQEFLAGSFPPQFPTSFMRCWHVPVLPHGAMGTQSTIPVSPRGVSALTPCTFSLRASPFKTTCGRKGDGIRIRSSRDRAGQWDSLQTSTELAKIQAGQAATACPGLDPIGILPMGFKMSQAKAGRAQAQQQCPITLPLNISGQLGTRSIGPCCTPTSRLAPNRCVRVGNSRDFTSLYPNLSL